MPALYTLQQSCNERIYHRLHPSEGSLHITEIKNIILKEALATIVIL